MQTNLREVADIENSRVGYIESRCFTTVVLPDPEGAEKMTTFFFI